MIIIKKIISGGQTGVDQGALDFALDNGIPCGGYCPKGRLSESGKIPDIYPLKECSSKSYTKRTELNVIDGDGTLIITENNVIGRGTKLTIEFCEINNKPYIIIDTTHDKTVIKNRVINWINQNKIKTMNVAGSRESGCKGIQAKTKKILNNIFI